MKRDDFHELILSELKDIKTELKEVRQTDIPNLKIDVAGFDTKLKELERQQTWSTRIYTVLGGAIAVVTSKFIGHH